MRLGCYSHWTVVTLDSDLTYHGLTGDEFWVPIEQVLNNLGTHDYQIEVDVSAWSGIHLGPGDTAHFQPVIRIVA